MQSRQPAQLAAIDDEELECLCATWRTQALRGDRRAFGIAHELEVERRERTRNGQLLSLPPKLTMPGRHRPWWKLWPARGDGSSKALM